MAKVKIFRAIDFFKFSPEYDTTERINSSKIVSEGSDGRDHITSISRGTFDKNLNGPIKSIFLEENGKDLINATQIDVKTKDIFGDPFLDQAERVLFGNDRIDGSRFRDVVSGFDGNDTIDGRGGKDVLFGADGKDKIFGGAHADELWGGDDRDVLTGGRGADLFVLTDADAVDKITDFTRADTLGISNDKGSDFRGVRLNDIEVVERSGGFNVFVDGDQVARVIGASFTINDIDII